MALNDLMGFPDIVPLIAGTGVQFLDFGFRVEKRAGLPLDWGFYDPPKAASPDDTPQIVRRGEEDVHGRESYAIDVRGLVETFDRVWMPLPLLRRELSGGFFRGPVNWARAYLASLGAADTQGNSHRLVVALDTNLLEFVETDAYLAPSPTDARNGRPFALPAYDEPIDWYFRQGWVREWCLESFKEMVEREERRRRSGFTYRPLSADEVLATMQGANEPLARYRAYVDFVHSLGLLPSFVFVDRVTEPRPQPIDVDFVLDLGNSRSCGLLVESEPDQLGVDITKAVKLQLRDLSSPEQIYADPFPSRFEFSRAQFGRDHLSLRSGRSEAFSRPTVVRVGHEAERLAARRRGTEGASGMSSPKRYLWDDDPRRDAWRFNSPTVVGEQSDIATGVAFTTLVNDFGEAIHAVPHGPGVSVDRSFPSIRALYSRRNLTAFALAEVFTQAIAMMNSPMHRLRRPANASLPRRLRRIILTTPTAMPIAERHILEAQAVAACDLAYLALGQAEVLTDDAGESRVSYGSDARPFPTQGDRGPEISLKWDEATATQAVYLYTQVALNYSGDARSFFDAVRAPSNRHEPELADTLRIATIDIGGGTTDLVVTSLAAEGRGAHITLLPDQLFREGFSLAGDDAVLRVVREHIVEPIRSHLRERGLGERGDFALSRLIGGDRGDMTAVEVVRRQQFATQVATPMALAMLLEYEHFDPLAPTSVAPRAFGDFFDPDNRPSDELVQHFNRELERHGVRGFDLRELVFAIDLAQIDRTIRSVFLDMLQALAEVVWRCRSDLLILSGRTSRLPAVRAVLQEACPLPPHRIVPLHQFRVGQWYPFRDYRATVGDPKTTAAVGAMICLLGNGQLPNFNLRSDEFRLRSTARYFGKLDRSGRLFKADAFYDDLNLDDPDYALPEGRPFEFRGPMPLGFRQLDVDWWPASRLYSIDYASADDAREWNPWTPLKVWLKRDRTQQRRSVSDAFQISRVERRDGRQVPASALRLRLQTIDHQQGYWLDTGVLFER